MVLLKKLLAFSFAFLLLTSCRKSTGANWDVDAVIPVVNSVLNIKNFVNDSLFKTDKTGLLQVSLNREVAAIKLDSILNIPVAGDTIFFKNDLWSPVNLDIGQAFSSLAPAELKFKIPNSVAIKKVIVRKGTMSVKFSNFLSQPVDLVYEIKSATKHGASFRIAETVPSGTNSIVKSYDMSGYALNMTGISGLTYNTIIQTYTFALSTTASSSVSVNPGQVARVEVTYSEMLPEFVEGYFGQQTIDVPLDTARFGLAENFTASNFMLSEATMDFTILNEFGAEFTSSLYNNKSINSPNNNIIALNSSQLSNINVNRASRVGYTIFPSVKVLSFTPANSNITGFISNLPDKLTYQGSIKINPNGNVSGYNDFAFYNTGIRIMADINIPLKFTADYFQLQSNAKVDFSNVEQLDNVNAGNFVISAENSFPFSIRLQGYMYDGDNKLLDSLFVPGANIIDAGVLNSNNVVISSTRKKIAMPITKTKIENLRKCKTIRVVSRFVLPPNPPPVKILESYEVKVNVVAELNYNVGLDN